ncbi:flagellar biosynthesis protein FlhB [Kordiimonas sp. SCSIO 12610]|uniref:flagellar biosynthesis protein FlhB n=1 Tax=Kordiimonas sp. SCSIO 12610 TaxID=2829597 RepID=UPI002108A9E8|nr:flagellar biosynthesis protein FlhB [Kordiimonas sp. SCSIO 12610]UTW56820.1 flagellar biosynthesis protein FlhB [Kordiimonas sp. SCSIO 12610]
MADEDDAQKTEEPTPKKLQDALEKGDVPTSQEFKTWFILLAATILIFSASSLIASNIVGYLGNFLTQIHEIQADTGGLQGPLMDMMWEVFLILMIPMGAFIIAGLAGNMTQHKFIFTFEKMKPKLSKISPLSGFKRIFGMRILVEFGKITGKLLTVGGAVVIVVWPERDRLDTLMYVPIPELMEFMQVISLRLFVGVLVVLTIIAALDYSYQKFEHTKKLKMTKQEVKDEHKQTDGDPQVKARLRQIRQERARQRMMSAVPDADVVITNPTHYAVAIEYKHGQMDVPRLLAKGIDEVAMRIREVADEHNIPIVENPPLARALHAGVELEQEVPPEHYKAVAEVIGYIMKLEKAGVRARKKVVTSMPGV